MCPEILNDVRSFDYTIYIFYIHILHIHVSLAVWSSSSLKHNQGLPLVTKKTEFLEKSSINIDFYPSFSDRREAHT